MCRIRPPQSVPPREEEDAISGCSEPGLTGSVVSSVADKYGFIAVDAGAAEDAADANNPTTDVDILRRREAKWLDMLSRWDGYMVKNYRKVSTDTIIISQIF